MVSEKDTSSTVLLKDLQQLHFRFGYGSTEQLVLALRAARRGILVVPNPVEKRKLYTRITPRMVRQFFALTQRGKTIPEIAVALNISTKSVTDLRSEYGFSQPRRPRRLNLTSRLRPSRRLEKQTDTLA